MPDYKFVDDTEPAPKKASPYTFVGTDRPESEQAAARKAGEKSLAEAKETMTSTLPLAGAVVGSALATGGIGPAMAAAGLGAGGGEAYRQMANRVLGLKAPETSMEAAFDIGGEAAKGALTEFGGRVIQKGAEKIINASKGMLDPANRAVYETAKKYDLNMTAGEIAKGRIARFVQSFTDKSLLGSGRGIARREELYTAFNNALEKTVSEFGQPVSSLASGGEIKSGIKAARQAFREEANNVYGEARQIIGDAKVSLAKPKAALESLQKETVGVKRDFPTIMKDDAEMAGVAQDIQWGKVEKMVRDPQTGKYVPEAGSGIPINDAMQLKSRLQEMIRKADDAGDRQKARALGKITDSLREAMNDAVKPLGEKASQALGEADRFYREGIELFEESVVADLMKKDPEALVRSIKPTAVSDIQTVKRALLKYQTKEGAPTWDTFRRQFTQNLFKDSEGKGLPNLVALKKNVQDVPDTVWKELTTDLAGQADARGVAVFQNIKELSEATSRVENLVKDPKAAGVINQTLHDFAMMGASAWFHSHTLGAVAGTRLLLPAVMTRIVNNKVATKYMIEGIGQVPVSLGKAMSNTERAIEIAMKGVDTVELLREARRARLDEERTAKGQGVAQPGQNAPPQADLGTLLGGLKFAASH